MFRARKIKQKNLRNAQVYPSILKIKNNFVSSITFDFPKAEVADINALLKQTGPKKATGSDTIPLKLAKMSTDVTDKHLCNIINMGIENYNVPDNTKVATVISVYKKKSRNELENYRPFSLLRILTGKNHPKIKLQRLRKIRIWTSGSLVHQINSF